MATQLLLWESALGYRDAAFRRTDSRIADGYFTGGAHANVRAVYEAIVLRIQEFLRTPSFLERGPLLLELTYGPASGLYTQRFTDTNGSNAELGVTGGDVAVRREGDDYIFSSEALPARERSNPRRAGNLAITRTDVPAARMGGLGPLLIWVDPACGAENQLLLSGVEPREKTWRACLQPGEEATTTAPETTSPSEVTTENITTTAECTTICTTATAIITTDCTASTETTTGQTTTTTQRTTHLRTTRTRPTTEKRTTTATTTATTTTITTTTKTTTENAQSSPPAPRLQPQRPTPSRRRKPVKRMPRR